MGRYLHYKKSKQLFLLPDVFSKNACSNFSAEIALLSSRPINN